MISAKRPPLWLTEVLWEFLGIRSAVRRGSPRASATCVDDVYLIAYAPIGSYVPYHRCIYVERTEFVARPAQYCRSRDRTGPVTRRRAATAIFGNDCPRDGGMLISLRRADPVPIQSTDQCRKPVKYNATHDISIMHQLWPLLRPLLRFSCRTVERAGRRPACGSGPLNPLALPTPLYSRVFALCRQGRQPGSMHRAPRCAQPPQDATVESAIPPAPRTSRGEGLRGARASR